MNDLLTITSIVRNLIQDNEESVQDVFVYNNTSSLFTLTEGNANSIDSVMVNDTESGVTYTEDLPKIRITSSLILDDVIQVDYKCYTNYSDAEIYAYIKSALVYLNTSNVLDSMIESTFIYPEPEDSEANLIALIASILISPKNLSYRMPDISISSPDKLSTFDKIQKVISIYKKSQDSDVMFVAEDWVIEILP